jgi:hypothetical protein
MNREEAADFNKRLSLDRKESESFLGPPAICENKESQKRGSRGQMNETCI